EAGRAPALKLAPPLRFSHIGIADKERFDALFRAVNPQISDLTFSNLLMWRRMINFRVAWCGGFACLLAIPYKYPPYMYAPVGDMADAGGFERAVRQSVEFFGWKGWTPRFRCVPADAVPDMARILGGLGCKCRCEEDRDFFDYVYLASDLIGLRGKKFDGKRNHISRFKKMYDYEYEKLTPAHIDECFRIMYDRCVQNDCDCLRGKFYSCDRKPSMELLSNFGRLSCEGAVVRVNGRCEAFTVGEALNADTAVIYIEKANASIQGLYAFINQQFCEREWHGMTYINREEDEGVEGLRKAKLSYHPARLVEKYTVTAQPPRQ
ncbi:MAG: phosphatidylglycerol lysyltransferase domain-containing protein, partial [Clostridiales bacterium]|nr:phosphatidylglycerol lysyltransferase domain-containing protein [Clostridiales bacterium]